MKFVLRNLTTGKLVSTEGTGYTDILFEARIFDTRGAAYNCQNPAFEEIVSTDEILINAIKKEKK